MNTKNNTVKRGFDFKNAFECLPLNQANAVRIEIIEQMGWHPTTFKSKYNGTRNLKKPEIALLKIIFEGYGIEF